MSMVSRIDTEKDFTTLIQQAPLVIVTSYRGKWCPFCRAYLREFDKARLNLPDNALLIGISVDTFDECKELQNKLKLGFDLMPDETLVMHDLLGVRTGKGHGKEAYLQPSVFVFNNGSESLIYQAARSLPKAHWVGVLSCLKVTTIFNPDICALVVSKLTTSQGFVFTNFFMYGWTFIGETIDRVIWVGTTGCLIHYFHSYGFE